MDASRSVEGESASGADRIGSGARKDAARESHRILLRRSQDLNLFSKFDDSFSGCGRGIQDGKVVSSCKAGNVFENRKPTRRVDL